MQRKSNTKIIYSMKYAIQLKLNGHKVLTTMPNPNDNRLMCWVFQRDQTFDSDLSQLIEKEKNQDGK